MKRIITKWIDLRPQGYEPIIDRDEAGNVTGYIYCPFMPITEEVEDDAPRVPPLIP